MKKYEPLRWRGGGRGRQKKPNRKKKEKKNNEENYMIFFYSFIVYLILLFLLKRFKNKIRVKNREFCFEKFDEADQGINTS